MADHEGRALNRRAVAQGTAAFAGPLALVVGGSLATLALTGAAGPAPVAAGARPTVTATATVVQRVPYPEPSMTVSRTVEAAEAPGRTPGGVRAQEAPAAGRGSGRPAPSPHPSPAPSSCPSGVLTVRLPLGALRECAITIGGNP